MTERWFFAPAERTQLDGPEWTVDQALGGDPGPSGAPQDGPEYELVALVVSDAGDAFLRSRAYATDDSVTGLVYFGALPPGVSGDGNSMTATRLAGPGGPCQPR